MPIEETARLYHCLKCRIQVCICRSCDHGNVYCQSCAPIARTESVKAARIRYAKTKAGRHNNAARQKRHIKKKKEQKLRAEIEEIKKITDHTSNNSVNRDLLFPVRQSSEILSNGAITCHFCGKACSEFLRVDFLQRPVGTRKRFSGLRIRGP